MKYFKSISAILISGLLLSACSSKNKNKTTASADPAAVTEKAAIPVKVYGFVKNKNFKNN